MKPRLAFAAVGALVLVTALGACTKVGSDTNTGSQNKETQQGGISTDPKDSQGPAKEIAGAKKGGTVYYLRRSNFTHLDFRRQYSVTAMAMGQLLNRTLTTFKELGNNNLLLIGDGASEPPTDVNKDCKVWDFKIRKGMKYEDGTEIKAPDYAYGISSSFNPALVGGATYFQEWLADSPQYSDVYDPTKPENKDKYAPGVEVKDDYTLRLTFKKARCETPYAATLPYASPIPKAKDTGVDYDNHPVSSGPYKIEKFTKGTELILTRNEFWDPNTDPLRHAYPDKFHVKFGIDAATATNRIIADQGDDKSAVIAGVDPSLVSKIAGDNSLQNRVIATQTSFVWYVWINNQRVTDLKVRQALNYAVDRDAYIKSVGGDRLGDPATTILSPLTIGYKKFDAYPSGKTGNPDKAKELLGGATPKLTLACGDSPQEQQSCVALKTGLEKAGFQITIATTPTDSFLDKIGEKANTWDIYVSGWASDWATAATTIPVLWDGRTIKDTNNQNYNYFNSDEVNKEIDRIQGIADPKEAAKAWGDLDKMIMEKYAPNVPLYYDRDYLIEGSNIGGLFESDVLSTIVFTDVYLKS